MTAGQRPALWCREEASPAGVTLVLNVHAQPGAKKSAVAGLHGGALRVRLAAPAVEGKANAELQRYLAECFGVALRQVHLLRGEMSRHKVVRIEAPSRRPDRDWA